MSKETVDIRENILASLKEKERTVAWLSRQTNIPNASLHHILKRKSFKLNQERLNKINFVLGTFFKIN
jgi:lambda repressor-like predicted transcriptional regulator